MLAPFDWNSILGNYEFFVYLMIGIGFGWVLESSGFGDSRKLAGQFYFKDMRVFKVMFTAILTAMVLIFTTVHFGYLDFQKVWVNHTYLWSEIFGGLIMGVGFIVGGFCPGTSLVAAATLKLDGIFFVLGVFFGIGLFGETVGYIENFWNSGSFGRWTLQEVFGVYEGSVILWIVVVALLLFYIVEFVEHRLNKIPFTWKPSSKAHWIASFALIALALTMSLQGERSTDTKWSWIKNKKESQISDRLIYIHPMELRAAMDNTMMNLKILDLRSESDYNLFHLRDAQQVQIQNLFSSEQLKPMRNEPPQTVRILIDNDESLATVVWKKFATESIGNVYILEGGIKNWIKFFNQSQPLNFSKAFGEHHFLSFPLVKHSEDGKSDENMYIKKIKVETKKALKGGCG